MVWKPDYTTLARLKDYLRITDTQDDLELAVWITAASRAIDLKCNRQFGQVAAAQAVTYRQTPYYVPSTGLWFIDIDDVQDTTGLLVNGVALASTGSTLGPGRAVLDGTPYTRLSFNAPPIVSSPGVPQSTAVTAKWGWTAVPTQVEAAVWLQVNRWNQRRDSPSGVVGAPGSGSEIRFLAKLDPDVSTTLSGLTRRRRVL